MTDRKTAIDLAQSDAGRTGIGFVRFLADGTVEHVPVEDVFIIPHKDGHVCALNVIMDGTCFVCGKKVTE